MDDLLQSQLREGCELVLPVGLQELMNDISREVLRSQPGDLYQFITNYLEALLNAREALSTACRICKEVSECSCMPQLDDELSRIGLSQEDVSKAKNIILDHFDKGQVKETNLLIKLAAKIGVTRVQLVELQGAVQRAFQRYILKHKDLQVSFGPVVNENSEATMHSSTTDVSTQSSVSDFYKPPYAFDVRSTPEDSQTDQFYPICNHRDDPSVSAVSLAGSFVSLPNKIPFSVHNSKSENILIKSEKSVMNFLESHLLPENRQLDKSLYEKRIVTARSPDPIEIKNIDSKEEGTRRVICSQNICGTRSKTAKESQNRALFEKIQENSN